jgi:hypothetical protein
MGSEFRATSRRGHAAGQSNLDGSAQITTALAFSQQATSLGCSLYFVISVVTLLPLTLAVALVNVDVSLWLCRLCGNCRMSPGNGGVRAHLCSKLHMASLAATLHALETIKDSWRSSAFGRTGLYVQDSKGARGVAWFNHISGEVGTESEEQ